MNNIKTYAVAAFAALALAGCGGGEEDTQGAFLDEGTTPTVSETNVSEDASVEYPDGLVITLQGVEDNTDAIKEYDDTYFTSDTEQAVKVMWLVENNGEEPVQVEIAANTMAMTSCFQGENRLPGGDLYGESGLFYTDASEIPTVLNPGTSFEYYDNCLLDSEQKPWTVTLKPYSFVGSEGEYVEHTFTNVDTLLGQ